MAHQFNGLGLGLGNLARLSRARSRSISAENFNGVSENVFPGIGSMNMLCTPAERNVQVANLRAIDPANWTAPYPTNL